MTLVLRNSDDRSGNCEAPSFTIKAPSFRIQPPSFKIRRLKILEALETHSAAAASTSLKFHGSGNSLFSFHLISSHRSCSWKLLIASHCHRSLRHPISSHLISCLLSYFHLISSQLPTQFCPTQRCFRILPAPKASFQHSQTDTPLRQIHCTESSFKDFKAMPQHT